MINDLNTIFSNYNPYINGWQKYKRASVTIPIVMVDEKPHILFEIRSKNLSTQPSEVCFPGGKMDEDESPLDTAIRETCEELGVNNGDFSVISPLDLLVSPFNIIIHPFLIHLYDIDKININTSEVEKTFLVPLDYLLSKEPELYINKVNITPHDSFPYDIIPSKHNYTFATGSYETYFYTYKDYIIWGITAKILFNFLSIVRKKHQSS